MSFDWNSKLSTRSVSLLPAITFDKILHHSQIQWRLPLSSIFSDNGFVSDPPPVSMMAFKGLTNRCISVPFFAIGPDDRTVSPSHCNASQKTGQISIGLTFRVRFRRSDSMKMEFEILRAA
jgi:hypothetical protein